MQQGRCQPRMKDNCFEIKEDLLLLPNPFGGSCAEDVQSLHFDTQSLHRLYRPYSLIRYWRVRREMPRIRAACLRFPDVSSSTFRMVSRSFAFRTLSSGA